jgi:outer membrane protein assembly factor BamE (lipoprotein component of BamABCDE complex)
MRRIYIFALVLLIASCGGSSGTKVDQAQITQFKPGITTYDQVAAALGPPSGTTQASDGTKTLIYVHTETSIHGATFIPVVGMFAGGADAQQQSVIFTFDKNGVLANYSTTQVQACSNNGINPNVSAANCQNH